MANRKLTVEIVGDASSLERALGRASNAGKKFSVGFGTFLKGAVVFEGVRAGIDAVGGALRAGVSEWEDQVTVAAQTNAVLKSTGGIANVTAQHVDALATAVSRYSGQDDEAVKAGENLLLTFKNVRNEVGKGNAIFDRATKAAVDLSQAGFGSIESTSKQMGKALNDPIKGLTALGRAGVTFTQGQKDTIKQLVETGHALDAQKIILKEVESQVGGSAKAFGDTLPGQLAKARESIKNVLGGLVGAVAPALAKTLDGVNKFINRLGDAKTVRAKLNVVLDTGRQVLQQAIKIGREVRDRIAEVLGQIDWRDAGRRVGDGLAKALDAVAAFVGSVDWGKVGQAIVHGIVEFLKGVPWGPLLKATFVLLVRAIIALDTLLFAAAKELGKAILHGIVAGTKALAGLVVEGLKKLPGAWLAVATFYLNQAKKLGSAIIDGIGRGLDNAKDFVLRKLLEFVNKILGVTGFLGRFDPFKGVRGKVQARLKEMEGDTKTSSGHIQRTLQGIKGHDVSIGVSEHGASQVQSAINAIKGKDVFINIKTTVTGALKGVGALAVGAADSEATAGDDDLGKAATVRAKKQGGALVAAASAVVTTTTKTAAQIKAAAAAAKKIRTAFDKLIDSLNLKLDKAQLTTTSKDDIAVLGQMETAIKNQIKAEGATTELLRQLFTVRQQKVQVQKDQFAALIAALGLSLDKAQITATFKDDIAVLNKMEVAIKAQIKKEGETTDLLGQLFTVRQQQAEAKRNQRNSKQFQALGLTETGEARTPSAAALLKRAGTLGQQIKGTILDTPKTEGVLARIAKVLSGKFGKVGKDVRSAIQGMLKDIADGLDEGTGEKGPLTKFKKRGVENLIAGLGLTAEQVKELRQRVSQVGAGGTVPGKGLGGAFGLPVPVAAGAGGGNFVIENHIFLDGKEIATNTTKHQQKQRGRGGSQRRGVRAGGPS